MKLFRKWIALLLAALTLSAMLTTAFAAEDETTETPTEGTEATAPTEDSQPSDPTDPSDTTDPTEPSEPEETEPTYQPVIDYTEVNQLVFAIIDVNIRTGPGTNYTMVGILPCGAPIRRIAIGSDGWSKVMYDGDVAYIASQFLSANLPAGGNVDDAELKRQIAIANGLNEMDYTTESWNKLTHALENAHWALTISDQTAADASAKMLKDAIANLVRMDYSALEGALSEVEDLADAAPVNELWRQLFAAAAEGRTLLTSGDQTAVDASAAQIGALLAQIKTELDAQKAPDVVIQEVPVEVPPTDDYCNIPMHRVWPVLFFISLALNVTLVTVIVVYISKKKRNQRDDTPLVDYNIFDDAL